jgi:hypothetical protein
MPAGPASSQPIPDADIVYLVTAGSEIEAMMWQDALRAEGITVLLRQGGPGMGAWASAATFEHKIFVRADQRDAALNILQGAAHQDMRAQSPRARRVAPVVNRRSLRKPA